MWKTELDAYVMHMRAAGRSVATIRLKRQHLERALTWFDAASPWEVTLEQMTEYLAVHDWAPESRKSVRSSLRGFYHWAEDVGHVDVDPSRKLPTVSVPQGLPHPAPTPVLDDALASADGRTLLMLKLAAYAGLRRAEIAGVHTDDVIGDTLRIKGKGGKVREVPLHSELAEALAGVRRGYVFPGNDNGHLSPDRVGRIMAKVLGSGWTAHSLRHRFATMAYAAERDLLTVQQLLGHSSVATTQRYTQVPDSARRRAVDNVA
jgi:integrase